MWEAVCAPCCPGCRKAINASVKRNKDLYSQQLRASTGLNGSSQVCTGPVASPPTDVTCL